MVELLAHTQLAPLGTPLVPLPNLTTVQDLVTKLGLPGLLVIVKDIPNSETTVSFLDQLMVVLLVLIHQTVPKNKPVLLPPLKDVRSMVQFV